MHQVPLAYMAVFARRASNPGLPVRSEGLYRLDNCSPKYTEKKFKEGGVHQNIKLIPTALTCWKGGGGYGNDNKRIPETDNCTSKKNI